MISVAVLLLALVDHLYGSRKSGGALYAADHIHYAPGLKTIYDLAERQVFDPYIWLLQIARGVSAVCNWIERGIIWLYDDAVVGIVKGAGNLLQRANDGSLSRYLLVAVSGVAGIIALFLAIN